MYGQLGNGTNSASHTPVPAGSISNAVNISAGIFNTCAALTDGTACCWGNNWYGQLGNGTKGYSELPVAALNVNSTTIPVQWISSNRSTAGINGRGDVKGFAPGTTTITAAAAGMAGTALLTVDSRDTTPPTGAISINNNTFWTKTASVILHLNCIDNVGGSGCAEMQVSNDGVYDAEAWEVYTAGKAWTLNPGNGRRVVYVRYRDYTGNISSIYTDRINLDTARPVINNVRHTPVSFNHHLGEKMTIYFTLTDNMSPTCDVTVKIYNSLNVLVRTINKSAVSLPAVEAGSSVTWYGRNSSGTLVPSGIYTYKIQAKDKALNNSFIKSGTVTVQ